MLRRSLGRARNDGGDVTDARPSSSNRQHRERTLGMMAENKRLEDLDKQGLRPKRVVLV